MYAPREDSQVVQAGFSMRSFQVTIPSHQCRRAMVCTRCILEGFLSGQFWHRLFAVFSLKRIPSENVVLTFRGKSARRGEKRRKNGFFVDFIVRKNSPRKTERQLGHRALLGKKCVGEMKLDSMRTSESHDFRSETDVSLANVSNLMTLALLLSRLQERLLSETTEKTDTDASGESAEHLLLRA